jgi:hypothetical protein
MAQSVRKCAIVKSLSLSCMHVYVAPQFFFRVQKLMNGQLSLSVQLSVCVPLHLPFS